MAANCNLFTDKETNNWFKASIALNVTKQGLSNFLDTELQNVHAAIGRSCGNCPIEKLIPCPTNPYCNKKKRNGCPFHNLQKPQPCPTCDNVKKNIILQHRYGGPSWRNTRAENWAFNYWEIGKCYLPPDGYSSVSTVQESDFNGVISIMLNCLHFQTCLSPSCLSPPPPDKQCPLEKVRQIGRDVRHTSICKVTDADLKDYFQTLSTLLADPNCLQLDPSAMRACTRLRDLQNDRMSIEELGELLKEANQTLEQAKEAGKRFSEEAERTLGIVLECKTHIGEERIEGKTLLGEQHIESKTRDAEQCLESKTQRGEQRIENKTQLGEQRIDSNTQLGEQRIERKTHDAEQRLESKTHLGEQRIESKTHDTEQCIDSKTELGEQRIESNTQLGEQRIERKTHDAEQGLESKTHHGEQRIESKIQHGEQRIESRTQLGEQCIERKTHDAEQCIESKIQDGTQRMEYNVQDGVMRMKQAASETAHEDYERGKADLRRRLVEHYNDNSNTMPLSVLDQSLDKRLADIFATPKIHRIEITKDGKRVKKKQVLTYKELFYTENTKSNRRIYVQGEPGSGKSTFAAKLVHDFCDGNQPSAATFNTNAAFDDVLIIRNFSFIFFISLRESRCQTDVIHMIQKQLIDTMYSEQKRDGVYMLLHQIIDTELCLVIRDGLDEWVAPDGSNLAEPSMAGFPKDKCTVLTTARPWKMADERIKNSHIDILLEIEGINDPYAFSERILRCILDESKDLETTAKEFESFVLKRKLTSLSYSPMLYTLVICTWVETIDEEEPWKGSSFCALYTTLLESLCKKANDTTGFFNDLNPPQVKCFSRTSYLRPIIQNVDVISKAAFHLLFSPEKEKSIAFNDHELSNYLSKSEKEFALKAGLISKRKTKTGFNASISFIHKSMQEFLAAYHMSRNSNLIDDVIAGYLARHKDAYFDISQVFIFLCGLNISSANKLSGIMTEHFDRKQNEYRYIARFLYENTTFQCIIEAGYREAVSNEQTGILLRLSHIQFHDRSNNLRDVYNIWTNNTSTVQVLNIHISHAHSVPLSHFKFDLSACLKLKSLILQGNGICFKDSASLISSALPVWIVLNSANPAQCSYPPLVLPCIQHIELKTVTCSCTWLCSLFSSMLTLDHEVKCQLRKCFITSCIDDANRGSDTQAAATLTCFKNTLQMHSVYDDSPGLWKAIHGLDIKSLSLGCQNCSFNVHHEESMSRSLSSLTNLETLIFCISNNNHGLCKALHGLDIKSLRLSGEFDVLNVNREMSQLLSSLTRLETLNIDSDYAYPACSWNALRGLNIKGLSLSGVLKGINVNDEKSMSQSLSSLTHLETLSIVMYDDKFGLWEDLFGLNIKSLSLSSQFGGLLLNHVESMSKSLSSLIHLETLSIQVYDDTPGLWNALSGLNIKSLSLRSPFGCLNVNHVESMSQALSSLTHFETLSIDAEDDTQGLWEALHDLNIKTLSLNGGIGGLNVNHAESMSQSLSSLKQLETLSIYVRKYIDIQLPHSLKYLNIYCGALFPSELRKLVHKLSAFTQTVESKLDFGCVSDEVFPFKAIPPEEYIAMQQELETPNNIAVKRIRILDRIIKIDMCDYVAASAWSVRGFGGANNDNQDDMNVKDDAYDTYVSDVTYRYISNRLISNRISMRLLIAPASNA